MTFTFLSLLRQESLHVALIVWNSRISWKLQKSACLASVCQGLQLKLYNTMPHLNDFLKLLNALDTHNSSNYPANFEFHGLAMVQRLRLLTTHTEHLGSSPNIHMVAHNHLQLQFGGICYLLTTGYYMHIV